jgi:CRISPR-associated protein Csx10
MRIYYTLTTIDPIIVSQNNATTNNHECLDYIPGSAILGALAAQYYATLSAEQSWSTFHCGKVQFSPCYPVVNNEIAYPTPASWNYDKIRADNIIEDGKYNFSLLTNHSAHSFTRDDSIQYKQCRTGFVNSQGDIAKVQMGNSTKTALDERTGSAKESQLFAYSFIESNQTFSGWIELKDNDQEIDDAIRNFLNSDIRIGRSRNTEFGRVKLAEVKVQHPANNENNNNELVLWCLSDCEFINNAGLPTLTPSGESIYPTLKNAKLSRNKSFIRSVKTSHFNQKRQGLDTEQVLISKGSVLTYQLESPLTQNQLHEINTSSVGINQQMGFGWISVNPSWSQNGTIDNASIFPACVIQNVAEPKSEIQGNESALVKWLSSQVELAELAQNQQQTVNQLIINIIKLYQSARKYHHILNSNEAGPSSTQWARIRDVVRDNNEQWQKAVFETEHAICKANNDELGWGISLTTVNGQTTFAQEIHALLANEDTAKMRLLIEQLCRYDLSKYSQLRKIENKYIEHTRDEGSYPHG